jgi:hypothetical protein
MTKYIVACTEYAGFWVYNHMIEIVASSKEEAMASISAMGFVPTAVKKV